MSRKSTLRSYQQEAINTMIEQFEKQNKQLCVLPTGSGKTVIFSRLIGELRLKTLIIAHTRELIDQVISTMRRECPELITEKYSSRKRINSDVLVCTIQSAIKKGTLDALNKSGFDFLVIDECHRSAAEGYKRVILELGFHKKKMLGVTATPFRTDKKSIYDIFGLATYSIPLINMIQDGHLVDLIGYRVKTKISIKSIRKAGGDFISSKLSPVINVKNRNELIVREYLNLCPVEKAIAFCCSVKHAIDLKQSFLEQGIPCEAVYGDMSRSLRAKTFERFKHGDLKVLTNCNLLTEGFDEPSVTSLLMARPTCSKALYIQMIGRGLRLFPGKENCKIIEFTDSDFDVCQLEDLVNSTQKKIPIKEGESFKEYASRVAKELEDHGVETIVHPYEALIRQNYMNRLASPWQVGELKKWKIDFTEPLLESTANHLLNGYLIEALKNGRG